MSFLESIDVPPRRTDRRNCEHCEATAAGCRSNAWLRGRNCCERCIGNHDTAHSPTKEGLTQMTHDRDDAADADFSPAQGRTLPPSRSCHTTTEGN